MIHNYAYSEEGRIRRGSKFSFTLIFVISVIIGSLVGYAATYIVRAGLTPYQRLYYPQFRKSFFAQFIPFQRHGRYIMLTRTVIDAKTKKPLEYPWLESQINLALDEDGKIKFDSERRPIFSIKPESGVEPGVSNFASALRMNAEMYKLFRDGVYQAEYYEFLYMPAVFGLAAFFVVFLSGIAVLNRNIRTKLKGVFKRGMRSFSIKDYQKLYKHADGFSIVVSDPNPSDSLSSKFREAVRGFFSNKPPVLSLQIPRADETKGTLLLGDTGTGKTVFLHQVIERARSRKRREPGVCYDPASEFVQTHYCENRDFILNPFDRRFPNWQLSSEIHSVADLDLIAESFFPSRFIRDSQSKFFNRAAQDVFKLILEKRYTNKKIVEIIGNPKLIDELVAGTEVAHKIDPKAGPQRAGVLASLADVGKILRIIPPPREGAKRFNLTGWANAERHQSWLFFTMTAQTRDALRPVVSAMLNILMMRLMSISPRTERRNNAWWLIADELHTLNSLSALPEFVAECRKHGVRYVFGTQSKHQIIAQYGEESRAILAQPKLKIFYRCNEPDTATWVSQSVGNQELDQTKVSASLPTDSHGRNSLSF